MGPVDVAKTFYESARLELIERIKLRDRDLVVYLSIVGTISSAASVWDRYEALMVIPFLSLGFSIIISQHNVLIGYLGDFCVREIGPFLENLECGKCIPQWDRSAALHDYSKHAIGLRTWGHFLLLIIPGIYALIINFSLLTSKIIMALLWSTAFLSMVLAIYIIIIAHKHRKKIYNNFKWNERPN